MITAFMAVLVAFIPRETPEAAGYAGCIKDDSDTSAGDQASVRVSIKECFVTDLQPSAGVVLCSRLRRHRRRAPQLGPAFRALLHEIPPAGPEHASRRRSSGP